MARNPMGVDARPSIADTNQSDNAPVKRRILARAARRLTAPFRRRRVRPVPPAEKRPETGTPGRGDTFIRWCAAIVLLGVAGAAAYVSYHHFYALASAAAMDGHTVRVYRAPAVHALSGRPA